MNVLSKCVHTVEEQDRESGPNQDCRERNMNDLVEQFGSEIKGLTERQIEVCKCSQHGGSVHSELSEAGAVPLCGVDENFWASLLEFDVLLHHFAHSWELYVPSHLFVGMKGPRIATA